MTITLLNGQVIDSSNVRLEADKIHFTQIDNGADITRQLKYADKLQWPDFDWQKSDIELYATHPATVLDTSTADAFFNQIANDPLKAPIDALNKGVSEIFNASGTKTIIVAGLVIVGLILLIKNKS